MKELVLHTGYGKFHLTKEIVDRMSEKGFDFEKNNLRNFGDDYYLSGMDDVEF